MPFVTLWGHPKCTDLDWRMPNCSVVLLKELIQYGKNRRTVVYFHEGRQFIIPLTFTAFLQIIPQPQKQILKAHGVKIRFMFQLAYSSAYDKHWIPFLDAMFKVKDIFLVLSCKEALLYMVPYFKYSLITEQYDAFVKFTHDQIMRRYGEQPASCKYFKLFSLMLDFGGLR